MPRWEIVKRPELESHSGGGPDPQQDWRGFVLAELGYDEDERWRRETRRLRWEAIRRFFRSMIVGALIFGCAFGAILAVLMWREGAFDHFLPSRSAIVGAGPKGWMLGDGRSSPSALADTDHESPAWADPYDNLTPPAVAVPAPAPVAPPQEAEAAAAE